ncbi:hypothetical protein HDF26_003136 [Pedobacter cryoconitis]|uniref:PH (Pleckstrin Homology) domain-containing protein n=1 Tax=Pedobacter cryoconitis TaxID=188932 RepID=A0A7W8ZHZ5_9SPHI|nr:hypothetical protein [Pedobacter cryoconitis]MBB5634200.1 hypothetical protein [Pedobacter cryoconitis]MBB6272679.1 hypothetical protein [Pedobacter cryoconitis]
MALYNLQISDGRFSIQPNLSYYTKIKIFLVGIFLCFAVVPFLPIGHDVKFILYLIGGGLCCYVVYEFLFLANVTLIFDQGTRKVYRKIPGIYTKTLMDFEEIRLVNDTSYGLLTYTIGAKSTRFIKNYPISDPFSNSKKGQRQQLEFETTILEPLMEFVK